MNRITDEQLRAALHGRADQIAPTSDLADLQRRLAGAVTVPLHQPITTFDWHRTMWRAAAIILALIVGAGVLAIAVRHRSNHDIASTQGDSKCDSAAPSASAAELPVPTPYADEKRQLVPLLSDLGGVSLGGDPAIVLNDGGAEFRYPDGSAITFSSRPGTPAAAAPIEFPNSDAASAALGTSRSATSGITATGETTKVQSPVEIRRQWLQELARGAAALPTTIARAVATRESLPPIEQKFVLAGHDFDRTVTINGDIAVQTNLISKGDGLRGDGRDLGSMIGADHPISTVDFEVGGSHHWLVFIPAGLQVRLDTSTGDRCTVMTDELTGGEYWLVDDGNADGVAMTETATQGKPTRFPLAVWSD